MDEHQKRVSESILEILENFRSQEPLLPSANAEEATGSYLDEILRVEATIVSHLNALDSAYPSDLFKKLSDFAYSIYNKKMEIRDAVQSKKEIDLMFEEMIHKLKTAINT